MTFASPQPRWNEEVAGRPCCFIGKHTLIGTTKIQGKEPTRTGKHMNEKNTHGALRHEGLDRGHVRVHRFAGKFFVTAFTFYFTGGRATY
ncbi:MAG: hypothetical protein FGM15_12845 [Chthoniobacterales bacterium]|nr:hypothetical protein [Chthoniobacterales bacterium]